MAKKRGCLKTGLLGCLGLLAVIILFVVIMAAVARTNLDKGERVDQAVAPALEGAPAAVDVDPRLLTTQHPGRVILELGQGEFHIEPAEPGQGLSARARFDNEVHAVEQTYEVNPDSTWVYHIRFHQTMPGMQALFRSLWGGDTDARIDVFLPPDVPIELVVRLEQGGGEAEFGGLWLTTADVMCRQGGFSLDFDEPLREPLERLRLHGRMGGVEATDLGNASPLILDVDCGMGGADIGLHGAWRNDCDARFAVKFGGMSVSVPDDMTVEGDRTLEGRLRRQEAEMPAPTLRLTVEESLGEVEIRH